MRSFIYYTFPFEAEMHFSSFGSVPLSAIAAA